jgi:hypothetical protein
MKIICSGIIYGGLLLLGVTLQSAVAQSTTQPAQVASWSFSAVAYTYIVPHSRSYVQPTIIADREWLHLEARHNYEDLETGSLWVGYNFSIGDKISLNITPMLGGVFGKTNGIAPGLRGSLKWWRLEFFSDYEYVFNTRERADSFFSLWSELTLSPFDWLRVGPVAQRTLASERQQDIERGFLLGLSYKPEGVAGYVLSPNKKNPKYILAVSVEF